MSIPEPKPTLSIGERLQALPRGALYLILALACSVPLFFSIPVPNAPTQAARDLFDALNSVPEGSTVLVASDWTNSTRGESGGQFEALVRILTRKKVKFAVYTTADPQAPEVARDVIIDVNQDEKAHGQPGCERWNDWVSLGFFPNAEGTANAIASDPTKAFGDRKDIAPDGAKRSVLQSPVLKNIKSLTDFKMLIVLTASATSTVTIERLSNKGLPLGMLVTGVMTPETQVYYQSGQLVGLSGGLKGVYDLETLMNDTFKQPGITNYGKGQRYYPALHFALALMILAVIIGNVGQALTRRRAA
jgi:hypothetical protein